MKIKKYFGQVGQSMVEIMVAAGLMGGLALGIGTLIQSQTKTQKGIEGKFHTDLLYGDIVSTLADSNSCLYTFQNLNWTSTNAITAIKGPNNANKYVLNTGYEDNTVEITSMSFGNGDLDQDLGTSKRAYAWLSVELSKKANIDGAGGQKITKRIRIRVISTPGNLITACSSAAAVGGSGSLWQTNGNTVYYSAGNVGVNMTTPSVPLTVAGTINAMTSGVNYSDNTLQPTGSGIWRWPSNGKIYYINETVFTGTNDGNVGIGVMPKTKLEIATGGIVKLDSAYLSGVDTTSANFSSNNYYYYNGSWQWGKPLASRGALLQLYTTTSSWGIGLFTDLSSTTSINFSSLLNPAGFMTTACVRRVGSSAYVVGNAVSCNGNETMTGGGCSTSTGSGFFQQCWPSAASSWACGHSEDSATYECVPYAMCCS